MLFIVPDWIGLQGNCEGSKWVFTF